MGGKGFASGGASGLYEVQVRNGPLVKKSNNAYTIRTAENQ
jgi:hypothetical protein